MIELRKDYLLDRWVIISEIRSQRPRQFAELKSESISTCFFCPGNESLTPDEKYSVKDELGRWRIRVFENKYPAVSLDCGRNDCSAKIKTADDYFTYADALGVHEIIVETNDHNKQLWDLSRDELSEVFRVYNNRITTLSSINGIKYVSVFKNSGKDAGTSIVHSHSQIIATMFIPPLIREKLKAIKERNFCPYCEILNIERKSLRRCFENDSFVAFTPYASRFHYEIWVMPKEHINSMSLFTEKHYSDLSEIMLMILARLKSINAPYNFFLHYNEDKDFHFMIEVTPRLATWAGYEESTGIIINSVSPESAAGFYRG